MMDRSRRGERDNIGNTWGRIKKRRILSVAGHCQIVVVGCSTGFLLTFE